MVNFTIKHFTHVTSTNDVARDLIERGHDEPVVIWADEQLEGRGRMGRSWDSLPGNLFCSVVLYPDCPVEFLGHLSILVSLSIGDFLQTLVQPRDLVRYKWPNDILLNKEKASGILLETESVNGKAPWVIVGCGVNIVGAPNGLPYQATYLNKWTGKPYKAYDILMGFLAHLEVNFAQWTERGFAPFRQKWLNFASDLGAVINVRTHDHHFKGTFIGIDECGALLLKLPEGQIETISSGDIILDKKYKG